MLVLSRKRDEVIKIGDDIEITVVDIRGDKVRLGITAPKEVMVHRKEVYEEIKKENQAAAQVRAEDIAAFGAPDLARPDAVKPNGGGTPGPKPGPQGPRKPG